MVVPPCCIEAEEEETTTSLSQKKTIHQKQFFVRSYRIKKKMVMICMAAAAVMVHIECERGSRSDYYTTLHILYYVIVAIERKRIGVFFFFSNRATMDAYLPYSRD